MTQAKTRANHPASNHPTSEATAATCPGTLIAMSGYYGCEQAPNHKELHENRSLSFGGRPVTWRLLHQFSGCVPPFASWDARYGPDPEKSAGRQASSASPMASVRAGRAPLGRSQRSGQK